MSITNERLAKINQLQEIETRIDAFKRQYKAVQSSYFKNGTITLNIVTTDYTDKGHDEPIVFDSSLLVEYITNEIKQLVQQSNKLLADISESKG